jgi:hypothetical protein
VRRPSRLLPPLLALVATAGLAGCASGEVAPGVAAQVGDATITVADLQGEIEAVVAAAPEGQAPPPETLAEGQRVVLTREVQGLLVREVATTEGVTVTQAEVDAVLDELRAQNGGDLSLLQQQNLYSDEGLRRGAEVQLLVQALQEEDVDVAAAVEEQAAVSGVVVNRRYGTWGGTSLLPGTGAIATAAAAAAEQPAGG